MNKKKTKFKFLIYSIKKIEFFFFFFDYLIYDLIYNLIINYK